MAPEVLIYAEGVVLDAYGRRPPDFILLIDRDSSEYGVRQFGRGYARNRLKYRVANLQSAKNSV